MARLLVPDDGSEDDYEVEPLTLVNRQHPVTIRRQAQKAQQAQKWKRTSIQSGSTTMVPYRQSSKSALHESPTALLQSSRLLSLPHDILMTILENIPAVSIWRIAITCRSAYRSLHIQKALFQRLFSPGNVPAETFKYYKESGDEILYDRLLLALEHGLGPLITHLTIHEFLSIKNLNRIARACPNLASLDFGAIMEPIDFTRYRRYYMGCRHGKGGAAKEDIPKNDRYHFTDIYPQEESALADLDRLKPFLAEQEKCYACRDRFQWPLVLKSCEALFVNLTSIRLMYEGHAPHQRRGSKPGKLHLPYLLKMMPRLQKLAFECWRDQKEKTAKRQFTWYQCTQEECEIFLRAIVENASHELKVLELNSAIELAEDIGPFTQSLETLPKLRTLSISIYHDLKRRSAWTWMNRGRRFDDNTHADQKPLNAANDYMIRYIAGLRNAISRGWNVKSVNLIDEYYVQAKPWRYFSLLSDDNMSHLKWLLRSNMNWNPAWKWKSYMYRQRYRHRYRPTRHDPIIEADYGQLRQLFGEFKKAGKPVRIRLEAPPEESGFFLWQRPGYNGATNGREDFEALPWRLDLVGDFIDEVELLYNHCCITAGYRYAQVDHGQNLTPEEATRKVTSFLASTREELQENLKFEAERISPFFQRLRTWCPHLSKLSLFIPLPCYAPSDRDFIERVLPGEALGWTVRHSGALLTLSGHRRVQEEEAEGWDCDSDSEADLSETEQQINWRGKITQGQVFRMMEKMEDERCPKIERVFQRRVDANGRPLEGLPSLDEEWNKTKRSPGVDIFDVTDFDHIPQQDYWSYLWPV